MSALYMRLQSAEGANFPKLDPDPAGMVRGVAKTRLQPSSPPY